MNTTYGHVSVDWMILIFATLNDINIPLNRKLYNEIVRWWALT